MTFSLNGLINGAATGWSQNAEDQIKQQNMLDLQQHAAGLDVMKTKALEDIKNAPALRFADAAQSHLGDQVPVTPDIPTVATGAGAPANADGTPGGLIGSYADLTAQAAQLPPEDQGPYLAQLKQQALADFNANAESVAGQTRKATPDEATAAALQDLKASDPMAYAAGKTALGDKFMTVPDGGTLIDTTTGKPIMQSSGKADRQQIHEDAADARQQKAFDQQVTLARMKGAAGADPWGVFGGTGPNADGTPVAALPHGDEFLQMLPAQAQEQVKALADGRLSFPTGAAMRSPYAQNLVAAVSQYDPSFDAVNYGARAATRKDFTSGKSATSLNALNTVLGHLDALGQATDALNNSSIPAWNTVSNFAESATGDPRVKQFEATKTAVSDELTKAWRGASGNEADIKAWTNVLDSAASPQQLHGVIGQIGELLDSKISSLSDQYAKGMGVTSQGLTLMSPHAQQVLQNIKKRAGMDTSGTPQQGPATTAPTPTGGVLTYDPSTGGFK